jgi:hypothetical protein
LPHRPRTQKAPLQRSGDFLSRALTTAIQRPKKVTWFIVSACTTTGYSYCYCEEKKHMQQELMEEEEERKTHTMTRGKNERLHLWVGRTKFRQSHSAGKEKNLQFVVRFCCSLFSSRPTKFCKLIKMRTSANWLLFNAMLKGSTFSFPRRTGGNS